MTNRQDALAERLQRVFHGKLSIEVPTLDTDLIEAGLIDSLTLVELLVQIEQEFKVTVSLDELEIETFRTVNNICGFLAARLPS